MAMAIMLFPALVFAEPEAPPEDGGQGGMGGAVSAEDVEHLGESTITKDTKADGKTYSGTEGGKNALLAEGGSSTLSDIKVKKTGDDEGDQSDFYGTNAAILAYNDAELNIDGGEITTDGTHANAVFATGTGVIDISDASIETTGDNSGGVMVTDGGTLTATDLTVTTSGRSSAAIRSDRGGGTLKVKGGSYTSKGQGSPAIYSTADITVDGAELNSTSAEGAVVEGANSITLTNTTLTDNNVTLNGNSETYKNIFLYQSMSGDADEGQASFTATDSDLITKKGDTIFVTNTTADIKLSGNTIENTDGDFLRIQKGKWGNEGSNGGNVTLEMSDQTAEGDIIVDEISTLDMTMSAGSVLIGAIDTEDQAEDVSLTLSEDSVLSLTGDTYLDSLENEDSENSNIYLNGHKLYVDGKSVSGNQGEYDPQTGSETAQSDAQTVSTEAEANEGELDKEEKGGLAGYAGLAIAAVCVAGIYVYKRVRSRGDR